MQERILVVDDEVHIVELVRYNLGKNGYKVFSASDGGEALKIVDEMDFDLILLDLMLPGIDGIEVCKIIKKKEKTAAIPIIMLTAKSDEYDKVLGLELGADDYITKPFGIRELLARIKVVLRRNAINPVEENTIRIGALTININKYEVLKNGKKLNLTLKEFELLKLFVTSIGKVFTRDALLNQVWGYDCGVVSRAVDVHIRHIRQEIEDDDNDPKYIETIRGVGYRFNNIN